MQGIESQRGGFHNPDYEITSPGSLEERHVGHGMGECN
jgi:hypothetical protein